MNVDNLKRRFVEELNRERERERGVERHGGRKKGKVNKLIIGLMMAGGGFFELLAKFFPLIRVSIFQIPLKAPMSIE